MLIAGALYKLCNRASHRTPKYELVRKMGTKAEHRDENAGNILLTNQTASANSSSSLCSSSSGSAVKRRIALTAAISPSTCRSRQRRARDCYAELVELVLVATRGGREGDGADEVSASAVQVDGDVDLLLGERRCADRFLVDPPQHAKRRNL